MFKKITILVKFDMENKSIKCADELTQLKFYDNTIVI